MWRALLTEPWWTYEPSTVGSWGLAYRWFNLGEAACWLVCGALVLNRWRRFRRSSVELLYAFAFMAFGLTDVREASVISAGLVLMKGVSLAALLWLRAYVIRRCYPDGRAY